VADSTLRKEHEASKLLMVEVRLTTFVKSSDFLTWTDYGDGEIFEDTTENYEIQPLLPPAGRPSLPVMLRDITWIYEEFAFN
jgi:hypothetical protein